MLRSCGKTRSAPYSWKEIRTVYYTDHAFKCILASSSFEMKKLAVLITVHLCGNKYYKMLIHFFMSCFVKAYPEDSITDHVFMSKLASTYLSMNKLAVVFMVLLCANNAKNAYSFIHVLLRLVYIVCRLSRPSIFLFFSHIYIFYNIFS